MADLPFFIGVATTSGGSGGGVTSYDQLSDRPIQNVSGDPVVISTLPSGVYNISGTWTITADGESRMTHKDDMFYVLNEDGVCKITWITAGELYTYSSQNDGNASSVVEDRVTKESDCKDHSGGTTDGGDGTMEVNSLNVSKLVQEDDEELILNCGKSAD